MANDLSLLVDNASLIAARDQIARNVFRAGTDAIRIATRNLEKAIENATQQAVPGRLYRAWKSQTFPRAGIARDPVGTVFVNGGPRSQGAMAFFTRPGRIRSKDDFYLAIPTPAAGPRGRNRDLTPGEWERAHGARLRFVYRPGRASLLVLDEGVLSGKNRVGRLNTDKRRMTGRGNTTVIMFVLVPAVKFANRFSIAPIVQAAEADLVRSFYSQPLNG